MGVADTATDTDTFYFFSRGGDEAKRVNIGHRVFISLLTLRLTLTLL